MVEGIIVVEQSFESFLLTFQFANTKLSVYLHSSVHTCTVPTRTYLVTSIVRSHQVEGKPFDNLVVESNRRHGAVFFRVVLIVGEPVGWREL